MGIVAGLLGCLFGVLGILTSGIIFVPLAALCAVIGLLRGLGGRSAAGVGTSLLAGILSVIGFAVSPSLWLLAGGLLVASQVHEPTVAAQSTTIAPAASSPAIPSAQAPAPVSATEATDPHASPQDHIPYYCKSLRLDYPYTRTCPEPWETVASAEAKGEYNPLISCGSGGCFPTDDTDASRAAAAEANARNAREAAALVPKTSQDAYDESLRQCLEDRTEEDAKKAALLDCQQDARRSGATAFVVELLGRWSTPDNSVLSSLGDAYADEVSYYGKPVTRQAVVDDKVRFATRWPDRKYQLRPGSLVAVCAQVSSTCKVDGIVDWQAGSPARGATSSGSARFSYTLSALGRSFIVVSENSSILQRTSEPTSPPLIVNPPASQERTLVARGSERPSFDCAQAKTAAARLICADAELAKLDGSLGIAFQKRKAQTAVADQSRLSAMQLTWIRDRNERCGLTGKNNAAIDELASSKSCMMTLFRERIAVLAQTEITQQGVVGYATPASPDNASRVAPVVSAPTPASSGFDLPPTMPEAQKAIEHEKLRIIGELTRARELSNIQGALGNTAGSAGQIIPSLQPPRSTGRTAQRQALRRGIADPTAISMKLRAHVGGLLQLL